MVGLTRSPAWAVERDKSVSDRSLFVAAWLFATAFLVFCMVVVGGATRLTGSGLSITQWRPVTGVLPPMSSVAWAGAFAKYQASSQYRLIHQGMALSDFKILFWWEWSHRLLGRAVGMVFAVPFVAFLATRTMPRWLMGRCVVLFALGALQGLVGWWMVRSGLEGRAAVAPERLATHLGLALVLLGALVWTGLDAWSGPTRRRRDGWTSAGLVFAALVFLQCLLGALVAGNQAGLIDGDWPLMAGRVFPEGYWQGAIWATVAHGLAAVQFNHRLLAYVLVGFIAALALGAGRSPSIPPSLRILIFAICVVVGVQATLGVATLLLSVPLSLALLHQANAAILFSLAIGLAWRTRIA